MTELFAPGSNIAHLSLPAVNGGEAVIGKDYRGKRLVLLFLPGGIPEGILTNLARYQENLAAFAELNATVIAICHGSQSTAGAVAGQTGISFPILADSDQKTTALFKAAAAEESEPAAYLLDEYGAVLAAYESDKYPCLPNPLAVLRALRRLTSAPRPAPLAPDDWILGPLDAPVVLFEYSDYQCPRCMELHPVLNRILAEFSPNVALVHRHLPLRHSHPLAQMAAEAAEAAGAQGKFWEMHHRLFLANCALEKADLLTYAREIGLDAGQFALDLDSRKYQENVNEDFKQAVDGLIKLPPTLFIDQTLVDLPVTEELLRSRIAEKLKQ